MNGDGSPNTMWSAQSQRTNGDVSPNTVPFHAFFVHYVLLRVSQFILWIDNVTNLSPNDQIFHVRIVSIVEEVGLYLLTLKLLSKGHRHV